MITYHRPLRSNMESVLQHAANPQRKQVFTRTEIIRNIRWKNHKKDWLAERKEKMFPTPIYKRIANVRKFNGGYKVVGILSLLDLTNEELKVTLKQRGFTGLRRGGVVVSLK